MGRGVTNWNNKIIYLLLKLDYIVEDYYSIIFKLMTTGGIQYGEGKYGNSLLEKHYTEIKDIFNTLGEFFPDSLYGNKLLFASIANIKKGAKKNKITFKLEEIFIDNIDWRTAAPGYYKGCTQR